MAELDSAGAAAAAVAAASARVRALVRAWSIWASSRSRLAASSRASLVLLGPLVRRLRERVSSRLAAASSRCALVGDLRGRVGGNLAGEPALSSSAALVPALPDPVDFRLGRPDVALGGIEREPGLCDRRRARLGAAPRASARASSSALDSAAAVAAESSASLGCIGERR